MKSQQIGTCSGRAQAVSFSEQETYNCLIRLVLVEKEKHVIPKSLSAVSSI